VKVIALVFVLFFPVLHAETHSVSAEHRRRLIEFQKPGSFDAARDTKVLEEILKGPALQRNTTLVLGALQTVLHHSPHSYDSFIQKFPKLRDVEVKSVWPNKYRTAEEERQVAQAAYQYFKTQEGRLLPENDPLAGTVLADWTNLRPLTSMLHRIPDAERGDHEDWIMESIVFAANKKEFKKNFPSMLFTVIVPQVEKLFGDEGDRGTNLEIERNGSVLVPVIYGTEPLEGLAEERNPYGFYSARLKPIPIDTDLPSKPVKLQWTMAGRPFEAKVSLEKLDHGESIVPDDPAPPYDELSQEGKTNVLIIFGNNSRDEAPKNLKDYAEFLKARGFEPEGNTLELKNLKKWFRNQIVSGESDIFIKEAHAHGDLNNMIAIDELAKLVSFRRKGPGGIEQTVRVAYPYDEDSESSKVTNQEFGEWMKKRVKETNKALLFMNQSCWSIDQAKNQVPEVASKKFIEIAATTIVDEIEPEPNPVGVKIILEGFLNHKSYASIREDLKVDIGYRNSTDDAFIFPDEERFKELVLQNQAPIRVRQTITDVKTGKPYEGENIDGLCPMEKLGRLVIEN
jgi:hypothetical protein